MSRRRRDEGEDYGEEEEEEEEHYGGRGGRGGGGGGGGGGSRRGFAAMPKEKVRAIAAKGGRASGRRRREEGEEEEEGGGRGREEESEEGEEEEERGYGRGGRGGGGRRGFAAMPKEKVRAIAAKGGRVSGRRRREESEGEEGEEGEEEEYGGYGGRGGGGGGGRRGFAAMPREKVRAIAAKGGRVSGKRRREESEEEEGGGRRTRGRRGEEYGRRGEEGEEEEGEGYGEEEEEEGGYGRRGRGRDTFATGPSQTVRRMYERGERKPRHSLREEDQGVGYLEDEESREDRMGYFGKGARKGFATMPRERVREIAAKGGRHSHGFKRKARYAEGSMEEVPAGEGEERGGYYRVGFAAMPRERVREIGRKGGRHSHGYGEEEGGDEYQPGEEDREHYPMLKSLTARGRRAGQAY